jgi:hypothetical protein
MIVIALDSVSLNHLLRPPRKSRARHTTATTLDRYLKNGELQIALDRGGGVVGEWSRTCNHEVVRVLITYWESLRALIVVSPLSTIPHHTSRRLRRAGFNDAGDKLLLRVALSTQHRILVSDDSDFWDPHHSKSRGDTASVVATLCRQELAVTVLLLRMLMELLRGAA